MKKSLLVFTILSTIILASCGGKEVQSEGAAASDVEVVETEVVEGAEGDEVSTGEDVVLPLSEEPIK
jgi:hypothetical protein